MLTNEDITTSNIGNLSDSNEVQINSNVENDSEFIGHDDNNIGDMVNVELDDTDFDFFDAEEIVKIEEVEFIPEEERLYAQDELLLKDVEDSLLDSYPLEKQKYIHVQRKVNKSAEEIVKLKNVGLLKIERIANDIHSKVINDYSNGIYNQPWIVPIIYDKQVIFDKHIQANDKSASQNENLMFNADMNRFIKADQKHELKELKILGQERSRNTIAMSNYLNSIETLLKPYKLDKASIPNKGFNITLKEDTSFLRYFDYKTAKWTERIGLKGEYTSVDVLDEHEQVQGVKEKLLIPGEKAHIMGFVILPYGNKSLYDIIGERVLGKFGKIGKITNISKAVRAVVTINNHGLKNNDKIYIQGSNSVPLIDGVYSKSLEVIDKDNFSIDINTLNGEAGTQGIVYSIKPLNLDVYEISTNDDKLIIKKDGDIIDQDSILNPSLVSDINKGYVYLLQYKIDEKSKEKLIQLFNAIIPNHDRIIGLNYPLLEKCETLQQMQTILNRYNFSIKDLDVSQFSVLTEIMQNNKKQIEDSHTIYDLNETQINPFLQQFNDPNYLYANIYLKLPLIVKYYGKYPFFDQINDNPFLRFEWLNNQSDDGYLFVASTILEMYNHEYSSDIKKWIGEKLIYFEKEHQDLTKIYEKEQKVEKYFNEDENCMIFDIIDQNQFDKDKGSTKLSNKIVKNGEQLSLYKKTKDGEWKKTKDILNYEKAKYLCEFKNIDLSKLDINQLTCIYNRSFKCKSRRFNRYSKRLKYLETILNGLRENYNNIESGTEKKELIDNVKIAEQYILKKSKRIDKDDPPPIKTDSSAIKEQINPELKKLLDLITQISNHSNKQYIIDKLIERDGFLIDHTLFSKKFHSKLFCGHYYFLKKMNYTPLQEKKIEIFNILVSEYGDAGEADPANITCKYCGLKIGHTEFDSFEGFMKLGSSLRIGRETWEAADRNFIYDIGSQSKVKILQDTLNIDCYDKKFKDQLLSIGLKYNNLNKAINLCAIISDITTKSGINLLKDDFIPIIIDSIQYINTIPDLEEYTQHEITHLTQKGLSHGQINNLREKLYFKSAHKRYKLFKKYILITIRILICLQTAIPEYKRTGKSLCSFSGFHGKNGIDYFACILDKMNFDKGGKTKEHFDQIIKDELWKTYKEISNYSYIKDLFNNYKRLKVERYKKEKIANTVFTPVVHYEDTEIEEDMYKLLEKANDYELVTKFQKSLYVKNRYIAQEIMRIISNVIKISPINDRITLLSENSCCTEELTTYVDYYIYIELGSEQKIHPLIDSSWKYYNLHKLLTNNGVFSRLIVNNNINNAIHNSAILTNINDPSEKLLRGQFMVFCHSGVRVGEKHSFSKDILNPQETRCMKCGYSIGELEALKLTVTDYKKLLYNIQKINTKIFTTTKNCETDDLLKIKQERLGGSALTTQIRNLVEKLAIILNKESNMQFKDHYINLITNLGYFSSLFDKKTSLRGKIKRNISIEEYRVLMLKNIYNNYFRKFVSRIKNNYQKKDTPLSISFTGSEEVSKQIQEIVYNDLDSLSKFFKPALSAIFNKFKFKYSIEFINCVNGTSDTYNCKYTEIIHHSKLDVYTSCEILLSLLIEELNNMIICCSQCNTDSYNFYNNSDPSVPNNFDLLNKVDISTEGCRLVAEFILGVFDIVEENYNTLEFTTKEVEKLENEIREKIVTTRTKDIESLDGLALLMYYNKSTTKFIDDIETDASEDHDTSYKMNEYQEKMDALQDTAKQELFKAYGSAPTSDQIQEYTASFIDNEQIDKEIYEDAYAFMQPKEGRDVVEIGYQYGEMPQGMETAGDGIIDDYYAIVNEEDSNMNY